MNFTIKRFWTMHLLAFLALTMFSCVMPAAHADPLGALNPNVVQANIGTTICTPGWTATIRPPAYYTNKLKVAQLPPGSDLSAYEEDHFVPLSIGGAPRDKANLWPQPRIGTCSASDKDRLELALNRSVCYGSLTLFEAQQAIIIWRTTYAKYYKRGC